MTDVELAPLASDYELLIFIDERLDLSRAAWHARVMLCFLASATESFDMLLQPTNVCCPPAMMQLCVKIMIVSKS